MYTHLLMYTYVVTNTYTCICARMCIYIFASQMVQWGSDKESDNTLHMKT